MTALKKKSVLFVLIAASLWGSMGLFVRTMNSWGLSSLEIVQLRIVITALIFLAIMLIRYRDRMRIRLKDIWCFLGSGLFSIVFFSFCYFTTILLTDLSAAAVLLYTAPSFVIVLSALFFREKLTGRKIFAVILAFAGCVLVTGIIGSNVSIPVQAVLTGLGSGFGYALYTIFSRFAMNRGYDSLTITFYTFLIAALVILPLADPVRVFRTAAAAPDRLFFSILAAFVTTVLPYLFYTAGLKGLEGGTASVIASVEPVVATIFGVVVFREGLTPSGLIGIGLVLLSILLCNISPKKNSSQA